jgi:hypothetical protein
MFERAFPRWGFAIWRGLLFVGILAFLGSVVFGALHGFATLRADYSSHTDSQAVPPSHRPKAEKPSADAIPLVGPKAHNCTITGGTNSGVQVQNCQN